VQEVSSHSCLYGVCTHLWGCKRHKAKRQSRYHDDMLCAMHATFPGTMFRKDDTTVEIAFDTVGVLPAGESKE
jgi:hypothetical protein